MIIGFDFIGYDHGSIYDSPVTTDLIDELELGEGIYDAVYVDLDTSITSHTSKPDRWTIKTIMNAEFEGNLDAGSVGASGFKVTHILLYRSVYGLEDWDAIGRFEYDEDFNVYDYVDRYTQNESEYQYAIVPVANEILGERMESDVIKASYEGIFITDKDENRKIEYDINLGEISHNTQSSTNIPINSKYPIVTFGNSNYRSGTLSLLPLSKETIALAGERVDKMSEQVHRKRWTDFINNGRAKVLRFDSGVLMLIATQEATVSHREMLRDLADISFSYTEIGELNFEALVKNDLITDAYGSKMVYDDYGGVISG